MNLVSVFRERAGRRPDAPALVSAGRDGDAVWSYARLDGAGSAIARVLRERGIGEGDRVVVLATMSPELYAVLSALWTVGAVAVFIDPSGGRDHMRRCCEVVSPAAFVGSRAALAFRLTTPALRGIPAAFATDGWFPGALDLTGVMSAAGEPAQIASAGADTPALITFTSGSTGTPKAAVRTHGFLLAQHAVLAARLDLREGEVDLTTLPVFAVANLASGVTTVVPDADLRRPGAIAPGPVVDQMRRTGVTRTVASPALLERLVEHCERTGERLEGLRRVHTGGAPVMPALLDRIAAAAPAARVTAVYGSTEAEPIAEVDLADTSEADRALMGDGAGLLAGRPIPEIDLRILRAEWGEPLGRLSAAEFADSCASAGKRGEIVVTGDHVLKGYLDGRGDEETKFDVDGRRWHRTGDAGYLDAEGRLWLLGRAGAGVTDEKGEVWPFAVECAASGHPGIRRTALAAHRGERVLVVEPAADGPGVDVEGILARLAWAGLDRVHLTREIPLDRRHNAKVDYPRLARLLERELR